MVTFVLLQGKTPVGLNLGNYSLQLLQHHHLNTEDARILISHDLPPGVLTHSRHLMWVGRCPMLHKPEPVAASGASHTAAGAYSACRLQKLVVAELQVSAL